MPRVLYSPGYGAGLTWTSVDPTNEDLLELHDKGATVEEVQEKFPDDYWGCWPLECIIVPEGAYYKLHEYDGNEHVSIVYSLEEAGYKRA